MAKWDGPWNNYAERVTWETANHAAKVSHPAALYPVRFIRRNGISWVRLACSTCNRVVTGALSNSLPGRPRPEGLPLWKDLSTDNPPCERCGDHGTELHHWAPKALFGVEIADLWPTSYLCRPCHREWHATIDGHQQRPKPSASPIEQRPEYYTDPCPECGEETDPWRITNKGWGDYTCCFDHKWRQLVEHDGRGVRFS